MKFKKIKIPVCDSVMKELVESETLGGGMYNVSSVLADKADVKKVEDAIKTLKAFVQELDDKDILEHC